MMMTSPWTYKSAWWTKCQPVITNLSRKSVGDNMRSPSSIMARTLTQRKATEQDNEVSRWRAEATPTRWQRQTLPSKCHRVSRGSEDTFADKGKILLVKPSLPRSALARGGTKTRREAARNRAAQLTMSLTSPIFYSLLAVSQSPQSKISSKAYSLVPRSSTCGRLVPKMACRQVKVVVMKRRKDVSSEVWLIYSVV